mmetsp:Transcript_62263/g.98490  ORF Transcript_62263/g.98490 Transcript_62263/m.98490 type:complete len:287 (+) Transcript_62263:48-908(+)
MHHEGPWLANMKTSVRSLWKRARAVRAAVRFGRGTRIQFSDLDTEVESGRAMVTSNRVGASVVVLPGAADGTGHSLEPKWSEASQEIPRIMLPLAQVKNEPRRRSAMWSEESPPNLKGKAWVLSEERFTPSNEATSSHAANSSCDRCHRDDDEEDDPDDLPPVTKCPENGSQTRRWEDWLDVRDLPLVTRCPAMPQARYRPSDWLDPRESDEEEDEDLAPMTKRPEDGAARLHHFEKPPLKLEPPPEVQEAVNRDTPGSPTGEESPIGSDDVVLSHADVTCELSFP